MRVSLGGTVLRGLVIVAIFSLGIAVGCSQNDGATATVVPDPIAPTVGATAAATESVAPAPTAVESAEVTNSDSPAVQPPARQVPRQGRGFVPLDDPTFLAADDTEYFGDDELVLGVEFAGEVRAYPVRMLRYHHIVNDTVGGEPLLVTY